MEGIKIIGDVLENVLENVPNNVLDKLTERQRVIYGIIKLNVLNNVPNNVPDDGSDFAVETVESLASKLSVSTKSIKRDLKRMKELGVIKREGGNFGGHREIIK